MNKPAIDNIPKAIVFMLLSTIFTAIVDALLKLLGSNYPPQELAFFRYLFGLIPVIPLVARQGLGTLKTRRFFGHLGRTLASISMFSLTVIALRTEKLGDVMSVCYGDSLFLVALSGPILREKVGLHSWLAVIVGFAGALIIMHPAVGIRVGIVIALAAGLISALTSMWIRVLSKTELPLTILFYLSVFGTLLGGLASIGVFIMPTSHDLWLMIALGLTGGFTQYFFNIACRFAPSNVTAPYTYAALVWSLVLQWLIWHATISFSTLVGATMIVGGGLYVFFTEKRRKDSLADEMALEATVD